MGAGHDVDVIEGREDVVRLALPLDSRFIRVARLVASGMGATAGFDVDGVEDLRIAVDELCSALFEVGTAPPIELNFALDQDEVIVTGRARVDGDGELDPERLKLSRQILDVACDEYSLSLDGGVARFAMRKRSG